jgi:hypothetical protein
MLARGQTTRQCGVSKGTEIGTEISPAMTALVAELNRVIPDLIIRRDRDEWREQAQALAAPKPAEKSLTWWRWLRSTG